MPLHTFETYIIHHSYYLKLRGLAVKLKKKVSDLSEQVKHLEAEKTTLNAEREEVQNKVIQISNNAKKLQVICKIYLPKNLFSNSTIFIIFVCSLQ